MSDDRQTNAVKESFLKRLLGLLFGRGEEDEEENLGVLSRAAKLPPRDKSARPQ